MIILFLITSCTNNNSEKLRRLEMENAELKTKLENEMPTENSTSSEANDLHQSQNLNEVNQNSQNDFVSDAKYAFVVFHLEKQVEKSAAQQSREFNEFVQGQQDYLKGKKSELPVGSSRYTTKTFYYTTNINRFDYLNDDIRYMHMDESQSDKTLQIKLISGSKIINREFFEFDTYKEASEAREKYTISDN